MSPKAKSSDYLFSEFQPVSAKEWKQLIQMELKGADYNQALVWESLEGIKVKPFYHADETEYLEIPMPQKDFSISQTFFVDDENITNKIALEAVEKGAEIIVFNVKNGFDADVLLQNFNTSNVKNIIFRLHYLAPHFIKTLRESFPEIPLKVQIDPIGNLASTGNWFINEKQDFTQIEDVLTNLNGENILLTDASVYQNAGANIVQQVAYALAHVNEYFNLYKDKINGKISVEFAIGGNYFFEMAKLRAFRYLAQELINTHNLKPEVELFAKPTLRNKSLYDYNVNILRTATENMSAVLGGADVVNSLSYDYFYKKSNEFSERIARNQLILFKAENEFEKAQNYAKGSYYIETLTLEIAKKSLELFKEIEKNGGLIAQLKKGSIQKKIKESAEKEQQLFDEGKIISLGVNKFTNANDRMKHEIEIFPHTKYHKEKTEILPVLAKRLAEKTEQERLEKE